MTPRRLILFVSGDSTSSRRARGNLERLTASAPPGAWEVEVVDVQMHPNRAEDARILATPTLSYDDGPRPRRIVGDLSDHTKVLDFLGIEARNAAP